MLGKVLFYFIIFNITMVLLIPQLIGLLKEDKEIDVSAYIVKDSKDKKIAA